MAQDGSWRFFDRGGEGGDAGRVLRDADRTVGDFGRLARQGFFSLRRAAQMNSRWRWRLSMRFARIRQLGRSGLRRVARVLAPQDLGRSLWTRPRNWPRVGRRGQANLWALNTFFRRAIEQELEHARTNATRGNRMG